MNRSSAQRRRDRAAGLGLAALAAVVAVAGGLVTPSGWLEPSQSGTFFPAAALLGVVICGLIIATGATTSADQEVPRVGLPAILMGLAMTVYAAMLPLVGLVVSTLALHAVLPVVFGYRRWGAIALFAVLLIGLCWLVFIVLMGVPLKP